MNSVDTRQQVRHTVRTRDVAVEASLVSRAQKLFGKTGTGEQEIGFGRARVFVKQTNASQRGIRGGVSGHDDQLRTSLLQRWQSAALIRHDAHGSFVILQ